MTGTGAHLRAVVTGVLLLVCAASLADARSPAPKAHSSTPHKPPTKQSKIKATSPVKKFPRLVYRAPQPPTRSGRPAAPYSPVRKGRSPAKKQSPSNSPTHKHPPSHKKPTTSPKKKSPRPASPKRRSPSPRRRTPSPSPKRRTPSPSPKRSPPAAKPAASPKKPATKPACFPGNYNYCKDPRTANLLLRAPGNNIAGPDVVPVQLPTDGSVLTINADQAYYLAGDYTQDYLAVNGRLYCGPPDGSQVPITLTVRALLVAGHFQCGSATTPYTAPVTITLTGAGGVDGSKSVMVSGNISWHGAPRSTWTTLATTIVNGTNRFSTLDPVDWQVGERIVVSSTSYNSSEYEEMVIAAIEPSATGGSTITTTANFAVSHWGELQTFTAPSGKTWTLDERGQVALLTRNIVIQGDDSSESTRIGAQLTVSLGGNAWVKHVLFFRMGEAGRLGSYPLHWHLLGDRTGNFVIGAVFWKSWNRCVTIHGTDGVLVERTVCHDHVGHGYFQEDGCETNNRFRYNLGLTTRLPPTKEAGTVDTDTDRLATFWITNPLNHYIGNVAAGSQFAGFWMVTPTSVVNKCLQPDQKPDLRPDSASLGTYDHNMAHSNQVGFAIEDGLCTGDRAPLCPAAYRAPGLPRSVNNLTIWKNSHSQRTIWITVQNRIDFNRCTFAGGRGTLFSGKQIISDSLFVGQSFNNATGPSSTISSVNWGFGFYDGPAGVQDSFFTRYLTNSFTCLAPVGSAFKGWPAFLKNIEFDSRISNRSRLLMRGNYSTGEFSSQAIIDVDGSLSGRAGGAVLVPWLNDTRAYVPAPGRNHAEFYSGAGCTFNTLWLTYICPPTHKLAGIRLRHNYIISGPGAIPRIIDVFRSDNKRTTLDNNNGIRPWNQFNVVVGQEFTYNISYRNSDSVMFDFQGTPSSFLVEMVHADVGDSIMLILSNLPTGTWQWSVFDCTSRQVIVPATAEGSFTFGITAVDQGQGGPFPNLKAGGRAVSVCVNDACSC